MKIILKLNLIENVQNSDIFPDSMIYDMQFFFICITQSHREGKLILELLPEIRA
jgi:hypothetical protein